MSERGKFAQFMEWAHHVYWVADLLLGLGVGKALALVAGKFFDLSSDWKTAIWLILSGLVGFALMLLIGWWKRRHIAGSQDSKGQNVATVALSTTATPLDLNSFLTLSYRGDLQAEMETAVQNAKADLPAGNRDALMIQIYAAGLISYMYDTIWWTIFRSQILALDALNKKVLRIEEIEEFYKAAAQQYPKEYANRSFDLWMKYLMGYSLILEQPANSIGITVRGKDFLKYLVHWGRSANDRLL